jgi:nucleoside-diphosphate-sugar epimerase
MDVSRDKSVLVTGGRGFIGAAVVKLLQRAGYRVVSLDHSAVVAARQSDVDEVVCEISDAAQLRRIFEIGPIGGIIHLAAILPTVAQREPLRATEVNVLGSLNVLEAARRFGVRRVVFGSSLSAYGTWPADRVVAATDRSAPEDVYGAAKVYIERLGDAYRGVCGVQFVSLRIGRVVGPGAHSVTSAWRSQIFEFLDSRQPAEIVIPYSSSEKLLLVHVDDVASMLVTLVQAPSQAHPVYNAPCESMVVADLKREVENLNSRITVRLGSELAVGNPRLLDASRFQREFGFEVKPIFDQLRNYLRTAARHRNV